MYVPGDMVDLNEPRQEEQVYGYCYQALDTQGFPRTYTFYSGTREQALRDVRELKRERPSINPRSIALVVRTQLVTRWEFSD